MPMTIEFARINCSVQTPSSEWYSFKKGRKQILFDVTGRVQPGQLTALMGESGSGKTTLLSLLARQQDNLVDKSGTFLFNGRPFYSELRKHIAFVPQVDSFFEYLTVQETLTYTALLKLPRQMSKKEKLEAVERVIRDLRLDECAGTKIGGTFSRGISGGEKKRLSIGVALLCNPCVLIMDEPTSGLDSNMAVLVTRILKDIAKRDKTIVCSIHQPSAKVFFMFDQLMWLVNGKLCYRGDVGTFVEHFTRNGFPPPPLDNPADFIMNLLIDNAKVASRFSAHVDADTAQFLLDNKGIVYPAVDFEKHPLYEATWWQQTQILLHRSFKQQLFVILNPVSIVEAVSIAVIAGLMWFQIQFSESQVFDRTSLLFFLALFWPLFTILVSAGSFLPEREMIRKERYGRYYRLGAYMCAKALTELPLLVVLPFLGTTINYFISNLQYVFLPWFETVLIIILLCWCFHALTLLLTIIFPHYIAVILSFILYVAMVLIAGVFIQFIPVWVDWAKYVSFIYYGTALLEAVQFNPSTIFVCDSPLPSALACLEGATMFTGTDVLAALGNYNLWGLNFGVLLGSFVVMYFLCFFALKWQLT